MGCKSIVILLLTFCFTTLTYRKFFIVDLPAIFPNNQNVAIKGNSNKIVYNCRKMVCCRENSVTQRCAEVRNENVVKCFITFHFSLWMHRLVFIFVWFPRLGHKAHATTSCSVVPWLARNSFLGHWSASMPTFPGSAEDKPGNIASHNL